jgi:hypothetical protein
VTKDGVRGVEPDRAATTGVNAGRRDGRREVPQVPKARFTSYYGKPVINGPVWASPDIPGYLYLGGLAGAGSLLAAGAQATGRRDLARASKLGVLGAGVLSLVGLVHDLGRPGRFLNMLRVFKVTSPMSVGSWLLAGFVPLSGVAAASAVTGRAPRLGAAATAGSALIGPAVASYTAALVSDTAVPAWHEGYRELPYLFVSSGALGAGGLGLVASPVDQQGPARAMALLGAVGDLTAARLMERRLGPLAEPYSSGRSGAYTRAGKALTAAGALGALLGRRSRAVSAVAGAALMVGSACTKWGVFHAGKQSANDPRYTVEPQRRRADTLDPESDHEPTTTR